MKAGMVLWLLVAATAAAAQDAPSPRGIRFQPDQSAVTPAPRLSDGRPDLTGVYQASNRRGREWDAQTPGAAPGEAAQASSAGVSVAQRESIPFRPEALARAQELLNRRSVDDPAAYCLPQTSPRMTPVALFPIEFVHTPTKLVILYEYFWLFRIIPIGGTHAEDVDPSFMGDSVARWEGDTLVVDVRNFKAGGWLGGGFVHSDALRLVERYTRIDRDQMNYEVTIEDPKVLTKPFTQRNTLMLREGARLREYSCNENNLDPKVYEKLLADPTTFLRKPE